MTIEHGIISEEVAPKIKYSDHTKGGRLLTLGLSWQGSRLTKRITNLISDFLFGRVVKLTDLPRKMGLSIEHLRLTTHNGTHVDSPFHYGPEGIGIDQAPLELFFQNGVRLDFRHIKPGEEISEDNIKDALNSISHVLKENDIVILWTGADKYWGTNLYKTMYPGLSVEGLRFLLSKGIKVIGTDCFGLDRPFNRMKELFLKTKDPSVLWPTHFEGRKSPYYMIEKLANLDKLDRSTDFKIAAFPLKIKGASAGMARIVAIIDS